MKTPFQRIIGYNLGLVLLVAVGLRLLNQGPESGIGFALLMALAIAALLVINLVLALVSRTAEQKRAHWLSMLLVLLIGFGACFAGASISG